MTNTKKEKLKRPSTNNEKLNHQEKKKKKIDTTDTTNTSISTTNQKTQSEHKLEQVVQPQEPPSTISTDKKENLNQDEERIISKKIPFIKPSQMDRAIAALILHANQNMSQNSKDGQLFSNEVGSNQSFFNLVITLKRVLSKPKHKPTKIALEHPLYDPRISPVCLIVKDPQREYKDLLEQQNVHFVSKVVGLTKLKGKHSTYEARKVLLNSYALFLADERVITSLPGILGSKFYQSNKLPIAVDLTTPNKIKSELEKSISNSSLRIGTGSCLTIKFADLSRHQHDQILQNLIKVLEQLGKKIPLGGWNNIQSVHIKTGTSTSLPIWIAQLGQDSPFSRFNVNLTPEEIEKIKAAEIKKQVDKDKRDAKRKRDKRIKISNKIKV